MQKITFLLSLLWLCPYLYNPVRAQNNKLQTNAPVPANNGTLTGILKDSATGKPIEYATLSLLQQDNRQPLKGALSDAQGRFTFSNIATGNYELAISFMGYERKTIQALQVTALAPTLSLGTILLSPSVTQLNEVKVEALRPTIIQEADKMVVSVEGTAMAAGSSAFEVLSKAPGVFVDQDGNIQLNGRSGVTLMVDGKLTYMSARDLRTMLEGMSAENIKNIEIITNPSARYDAEGASGILNINLKKNTQRGINGSLYTGANYNGKQYGFSTGTNINYKTDKWNSFAMLDMARRVGGREATFTRVFYTEQGATYFDQVASGNYMVQGPPSVRIGTDYSFNDKHSIGLMSYFATNFLRSDFLTDTYIGNAPEQPQQYIDANNYTANRFTNFTSNLHYNGKLDTSGTTLTADLDLARIRNQGYSNFYNYFYNLASDLPDTQDFLYTHTPNGFDIYAAKIDFTKPLGKGYKIELGAKASHVASDNDSRFYFNNTEVLELDLSRTNHFVYDENIYAAYATMNGKLTNRYTLQAGLRAERTQSRGESLTTEQITERSYLNLFPSLFLQQKVNDNYQVNYSYSRRIQRPNYGNLNPFIAYRDPYTYVQGNPYLRPQYTHAISITQTFKKTYSITFNYQLIKDVMSELPLLDVEHATTIYTTGNLDYGRNIGLTGIIPLKFSKNWESTNTLIASHNEFNMVLDQALLVNKQLLYVVQSNHNVRLPYKLKLEVNAAYRGPGASGLYRIAPMWWVHMGVKRSFMKDKLDLSININDIFKTYRLVFTTDIGGNINDFDQYFRNRSLGFTLRYNFSRGVKFDTKRRNTNLDELNRTGS